MIKPGMNPLAPLLLEIAGKCPVNWADARRHARILAQAIPHLQTDQGKVARYRISQLETKWGNLLDKPEGEAKSLSEDELVQLTARWLVNRKKFSRIESMLEVLSRAAEAIHNGVTSTAEIMDRAYAHSLARDVRFVGYDTFRTWLLALRIGKQVQEGAGWKKWRPTEHTRNFADQGFTSKVMSKVVEMEENQSAPGSDHAR